MNTTGTWKQLGNPQTFIFHGRKGLDSDKHANPIRITAVRRDGAGMIRLFDETGATYAYGAATKFDVTLSD